jgi:hypothetical protein
MGSLLVRDKRRALRLSVRHNFCRLDSYTIADRADGFSVKRFFNNGEQFLRGHAVILRDNTEIVTFAG